MSTRVVGLRSRRRWNCPFLKAGRLQEQVVGWSGCQGWRFERVTLEAPVRYPCRNNVGSGVFRVRNCKEGLI